MSFIQVQLEKRFNDTFHAYAQEQSNLDSRFCSYYVHTNSIDVGKVAPFAKRPWGFHRPMGLENPMDHLEAGPGEVAACALGHLDPKRK